MMKGSCLGKALGRPNYQVPRSLSIGRPIEFAMPDPSMSNVLMPIRPRVRLENVGNKALNVQMMMSMGLKVPQKLGHTFLAGGPLQEGPCGRLAAPG